MDVIRPSSFWERRTDGNRLGQVNSCRLAERTRKNGVPYSDKAVLTEYFERFTAPNGDEWFVVTSIVEDPTYLTQPFITSTHFRKERDGSKWAATPCGTSQAAR